MNFFHLVMQDKNYLITIARQNVRRGLLMRIINKKSRAKKLCVISLNVESASS